MLESDSSSEIKQKNCIHCTIEEKFFNTVFSTYFRKLICVLVLIFL